MAADVLPKHQGTTGPIEGDRSVYGARGAEEGLAVDDPLRHARQHIQAERLDVQRLESFDQLVDGHRTAYPARRGGRPQPRRGYRSDPAGFDGDVVEFGFRCRALPAVSNGPDRGTVEHSFRDEKADGQLEVVARGAHGGGNQFTVEAHGHGLLDDQVVLDPPGTLGVMPARQHPLRPTPAHRPAPAVTTPISEQPPCPKTAKGRPVGRPSPETTS